METAPLRLRPLSQTATRFLGVPGRSPATIALHRDHLLPQAVLLHFPALPRSLTVAAFRRRRLLLG